MIIISPKSAVCLGIFPFWLASYFCREMLAACRNSRLLLTVKSNSGFSSFKALFKTQNKAGFWDVFKDEISGWRLRAPFTAPLRASLKCLLNCTPGFSWEQGLRILAFKGRPYWGIPRDKMNCSGGYANCFVRVTLMYQPSCLLPCCQGKPGELAKKQLA